MVNIKLLDRNFMEENIEKFLDFEDQFKQDTYERWNKDNFLHDLPEKWSLSKVALESSEIVAYLIISAKKSGKQAYIHKAFVSPSYQNKGIFSAIMRPTMRFLSVLRYQSMAWSCPAENKDLINSYTRNTTTRTNFVSPNGKMFYIFERNII